ncbi:hypothetical protein ACA910_001948 [Epithemia clementina (nom. ined.)]
MPWKDHQHHFSGIPPHVVALHDLMVVQDKQRLLVDKFIEKICLVLDKRGIEGDHLMVHQLQEILGNGLSDVRVRLDQIEGGHLPHGVQEQEVARDLGQPVNNSTFTPHCHLGIFTGSLPIGGFQELECSMHGDTGVLVIQYRRYLPCN